jgi:acetyl-CoA carboxylase biotin carboxyl carrier protein
MNEQDIFRLIDRFEDSSLLTLKLSAQDFSLELSRAGEVRAAAPAPVSAEQVKKEVSSGTSQASPTINAPLVGAYYAAPAPDQPPFVQVGDRVEKGQTVCLIEAMKMMSEIPAPCACVIEEILKENGDLASFNEPLIRYRPC